MNDKFKPGDRVQLVPEFLSLYTKAYQRRFDRGRIGTVYDKTWGRYCVEFLKCGRRRAVDVTFHSLELKHAES
jgi:ribosomal protein L21E